MPIPLPIIDHPAARVALAVFKMVFAAAALSLLIAPLGGWLAGAEGSYWGWIAGATAGLIAGPFARMNVGGFKLGRSRHGTRETSRDQSTGDDHKARRISSAPVAALIGCLAGGFVFLPISTVAMLIWFSVAQSPWGQSVEAEASGTGATFTSSDLSLFITAAVPVLVGAIAGMVFCLVLFFTQQKGKRPD